MKMVHCGGCGEYKPHTALGFCFHCYERMRYKRDKVKRLAISKRWRENNREYKKMKDREYTKNNKEQIKQYHREFYVSNRDKILKYHYNWRKENPNKHKAQWTIQNDIRLGKLKRQPCEICGDSQADAHHDDYSKPREIRWLCRKHHLRLHSEN